MNHVECFDLLKAEWSIHAELESERETHDELTSIDYVIKR
jgi:hypothetical protein